MKSWVLAFLSSALILTGMALFADDRPETTQIAPEINVAPPQVKTAHAIPRLTDLQADQFGAAAPEQFSSIDGGALPPPAPLGPAGGGACCMPDDVCQDVASEAECDALIGLYRPGEACDDGACGIGACCSQIQCLETTAYSCFAGGRDFIGAGATCADDPCGLVIGACCVDGACSILDETDCTTKGGVFLGPGSICETGLCDLGACCLSEEKCFDGARHECNDAGGKFFAGAQCIDEPCVPPSECPDGSLFDQTLDGPFDATAYTSELDEGLQRFEYYTGVAGEIEAVTFWGVDLEYVDHQWIECEESNPLFFITFHKDAGGVPGEEICTQAVLADRIPTGIDYNGTELNRYEATLISPCVLVNGWVSIVGAGDLDCSFLWMSSSAGDGTSYCAGCLASVESDDLAVCLVGQEGGVIGACCDDLTGECADNVDIVDCTAVTSRFAPDDLCDNFKPECGVILGACCFNDNICTIETQADCDAAGGSWLGANTLCDQCPCELSCPAGAIDEGEPTCEPGYVDVFNGGCFADDVQFSPILTGQTVCGVSGVYKGAKETEPDWDWYEITVTEVTGLQWTVQAEFPVQAGILDGNAGCPAEVLEAVGADGCTEFTVGAVVQPGTYWLVVGPLFFDDESICGAEYVATVPGDLPCVTDLDGDGETTPADLAILLGAWGTSPGGPPDFDGSGNVGAEDLATLLGNWGPCP